MEDDNRESTGGNPETFKELLFSHLAKLSTASMVEMRGGYYSSITTKSGAEKEAYIQDTREILCNGIWYLAIITIYKFDKKMKDKYKEFNKKLKEIEDTFIEKSSVSETVILGEGYYQNPKDQILLEEYRINKLRLFKDLLMDLNILFGDHNWMDDSSEAYDPDEER